MIKEGTKGVCMKIKRLLLVTTVGLFMVCGVFAHELNVIQQFPESSAGNWCQLRLADVNGDGNNDMVGRFSEPDEGTIVGIWLFHTETGLFSDSVDCKIDLDFTANNSFVNAGDFNDDGFADIVMLSQYSLDHPPKIVWGRAEWPTSIVTPDLECAASVDDDFQQTGQYASPVVGDWNGDYIMDFAYPDQGTSLSTGNYGGRCIVHYGDPNLSGTPDLVINLQGTDLGIPVTDVEGEELFLRWFSPFMDTGDFNGDGFDDLMAGAFYSSSSIVVNSLVTGQDQEAWNCGAGLVFLGGFDFDDNPDVIMVPPDEFLQFTSPADFFYAGYWTMNLGDLNGDGTDEFGLPSWYWSVSLVYSGNHGYMMAPTIFQSRILRDPTFYFTNDRYSNLGYSDQWGPNLYGIGDIDGDGTPDLGNARDFLGAGPLENGIRIFLVDPDQTDAIEWTFESEDYNTVMGAHLDIDGDGKDEFFASSAGEGNLLTLLSYASGVAVDEEDILPKQFSLNQNYPNPFNPTTTISFNLPKRSSIQLSVYDVSGKRVALLAQEKYALGYQEIHWDASDVQSGVYFYELSTPDFRQVKKMVLVK